MAKTSKKRSIPLYLKIILGLVLGVLWGIFVPKLGLDPIFTKHYISPFGDIFIRLLKMIAVPLILASLIIGITNLKDMSKFSRIGGKTIGAYIFSTLIAIMIGLTMVNIINPGKSISAETRNMLQETYALETSNTIAEGDTLSQLGPLAPVVNMVPKNINKAFSDNSLMLQTVFFAIFFAIALLFIEPHKAKPVTDFFSGVNDAILKMIDFIMEFAPIGVFALIASQIAQINSPDLLYALISYSVTVVVSLAFMLIIYTLVITFFSGISPIKFLSGIFPAQLLAFSSSSSSATLPLTMKQCEEKIGVDNEVASFVLPLGSTINMDGTSLYQAIAAVFIAQVYGMDLSLGAQMGIVLTALLSSIGAAGVPGAGMILLGVILSQQGIPLEGIALIMAPDRILDMCRTVINVTGDATVATLVAQSENKLSHTR